MSRIMGIIHSLLNLFGFHNITDKHCNKDEYPVKEPVQRYVASEMPYEIMGLERPIRDSDFCPYQIWVQNFPFYLCHAQHEAIVACPLNVVECEIRREELTKHKGCPYYDDLEKYCTTAPGKNCDDCSNKWKSYGQV